MKSDAGCCNVRGGGYQRSRYSDDSEPLFSTAPVQNYVGCLNRLNRGQTKIGKRSNYYVSALFSELYNKKKVFEKICTKKHLHLVLHVGINSIERIHVRRSSFVVINSARKLHILDHYIRILKVEKIQDGFDHFR